MTGFSVTIVGISLCPDSALSLSESVIRSYINFVTFPNQNPLKINGLQLEQWWYLLGYGGHVWYISDMLGVVGRQLLIPVYMDMPAWPSLGLRREHILDFLRIDDTAIRECEFTILECPSIWGTDKILEALTVFQMTVQVGLQPLYTVCHCRVWSEVAYIDKSVLAFQEETEDECFYLLVQ